MSRSGAINDLIRAPVSRKKIAENDHVAWYHVDGTGETGPFSAEQFKEKVANSIGSDQFFCCDGMNQWKRVDEFRAIFAAKPSLEPPSGSTRIILRDFSKHGYLRQILERLFIAFNLLMGILLIYYWIKVIDAMVENEVGKADAYVATAIILFCWLAGDVIIRILLFLTCRPRSVIREIQTQERSLRRAGV